MAVRLPPSAFLTHSVPLARVTLTAVHKRYPDGFHAVRGVDLSIADGELVVLVGPSGCGKSTTLRMIAGLEEITEGEVKIGNRVVNRVEPGKRDIAMVFQNYALYPHMTVRKNMAFGLKMRRTPKAEIADRVAAAAEMLGIAELLDRRPAELSGGQRQRVALGRAIVRDPAAFLFDEPLSNLDAKLRGETRTEIAELHQRLGATMVYVTHDQVEAMTLGERLVLMNEGEVQQVATPLEVYRRPANRFVATFIGSPSMNLLDGTIADGRFTAGEALWPVDDKLPAGPACLGVRPDDLRPANDGQQAVAVGHLGTVEQLGHETLAHYRLGGGQDAPVWIARLPGAAHVPETTPLAFAPEAAHLFAATDRGERLN